MNILANFMSIQHPCATKNAFVPQAPASPLHAPSMHETHTLSIEDPIKETTELIKNLKPPIFKGEDKEWNKDNVDTFLSKCVKTHAMRGTHDHNKPCHTCLLLEDKAYKWCMGFKVAQQLTTWARL